MTTKTRTEIDFPKHAKAVIGIERLKEMVLLEVDHLDDPEGEILAQLEAVTTSIKSMFGKTGKAH